MKTLWRKCRRRLWRFWQHGLDTPFVVTYTMVVLTGLALLAVQVAAFLGVIGAAEQQFGVVLLALTLLLVLALQARAHDRIRQAHSKARDQQLHLRRACDELIIENQLRHAHIEELSIIRELGLAINSILDFDRLLATSAKLIADTVEATGYILFFRQRDGVFTCPLAFRHNAPLPENDAFVAQFRARQLAPGLKASSAQIAADPVCGRMFLVPLADTEQTIGLLALFEPRRLPFGDDQLGLLSQLGKHLALALKNALLYDLAITDGLTGLYVHRHFQHRLQQEFETAKRYHRPLAIIFCDIDHFKKFNDTYGHQLGDLVLQTVAATIRGCLRASDSPYRYGGEEMSVILPETDLPQAAAVAERIRHSIATRRVPTDQGDVGVTASFGVAVHTAAIADKDMLIKAADTALYAAKEAGRNCVIIAGQTPPAASSAATAAAEAAAAAPVATVPAPPRRNTPRINRPVTRRRAKPSARPAAPAIPPAEAKPGQ